MLDNENDQMDAVKSFFAENGKALVVGVVLGVGALVGWRYWNGHQSETAMKSSLAYETVTAGLQADKPESLDAVQKFAADTNNTYGALAAMQVAQQLVDKNDLDKAAAELSKGVADAKDEQLKSLMNLRLARIQIQLKQADAALKTLDTVKGEGWAAITADIRGEALLSKGDKQGARDAWSKGAASDSSPALREMMQMKINNLSS